MKAAQTHKVTKILAEPNFGGGMFTALLKGAAQRYYPCTVEDAEWSRAQKEQRIIDTLEPVMNQHRLVVCSSVIEADYRSTEDYPGEDINRYRLFFQLTRVTRDRGALSHDDRLDALAGAVNYWSRQLARDTARAAKDHEDDLFQQRIQRLIENAHFPLGRPHEAGEGNRGASSVVRQLRRI